MPCQSTWPGQYAQPALQVLAITAASQYRYSKEQLEKIDNEGRCVITDHGRFVLFSGMPQQPSWQHPGKAVVQGYQVK